MDMAEGLIYGTMDTELLKNIPTHTPGGVFIVETGVDRILYVGANMLKMLSYTEESFREKIGDDFYNLVYPEDRERVRAAIKEQEKRSGSVRTVYRIQKGDGTLMWVVAESNSRMISQDRTVAYIAILDVTGTDMVKAAMTESSNDLTYILGSIMAGIVVYRFQSDGIHILLEEANDYCANIVGLGREGLVGLNEEQLFTMIDPEDHEMVRTFFAGLCTGNGHQDSITYRLLSETGESKYYLCQCSSNRQPDGTYRVYCVYTDTSHQMARQAEFNVILHNFLTANPDSRNTFRLNLSENLCLECYGTAAESRDRWGFYTAEDLLDGLCKAIANQKTSEEFKNTFTRKKLLKAYQEGQNPSVTYKRYVPGEKKRWVRTYFYLLQNPSSDDIECIGYTVDIDHLYKEEQIISLIADREYDSYGVIEIDTGAVEYFNTTEENVDGIDERLVQKPEDGVQAVLDHMETDEEREAFKKNMEFSHILEEVQKNGFYTYAYSFGGMRKQMTYHYLDEDHEELIFAAKDVTEAFRMEEENAGILRQALDNAQMASRQKTSFFGNASHDLRTPLNAIIGYDELLLEREDVSGECRDYLEKIHAAGKNMLTLVNDMLDLQRIESGELKLKPAVTEGEILAEEILASVSQQAESKNIALNMDFSKASGQKVWIDPLRYRQVCVNLLSNAIKFTPEGGTVTFRVITEEENEKSIRERFEFEDNGVGMTKDFVENRLFEPFAQERNKDTAHIGGTGLGMSIVKKTVELMGGTIDVQSEVGKGTKYTITLDVEKAEAADPVQEVKVVRRSIAGMKILLCEDNAMNAEIASEILKRAGADVAVAYDGKQGVEKVLEEQFDVVLMDIRMPVMNGYEAARAIRQFNTELPIIALSADAFESDRQEARKAGMNGHLAKPLNVDELIAEVSKYA